MQPVKLELLAPAKTSDIGIAAIDCGADAVYIAGPGFGARAAAGNDISDVARLTAYAHKFSARIYATVNTIIFDEELPAVEKMIRELYDAGVDALIVQDLGITRLDLPPIELHASTQCAIRTPQQAGMLQSLGFKRLILERQLSLDEIRAIRAAVDCELEFFVHGAICVSYSGNCYLSQYLTGRSANRGACIQACRSLYDVVDADRNKLVQGRPVLSPKDYCLDDRLEELADAGISSFKIEGRLKNDSYVKNLCRHYRGRIDEMCSRRPEYIQASSGTLEGGFTPNPSATFNRGYTQFFIDGRRSRWNSPESTKSLGEYVGSVSGVRANTIKLAVVEEISNGDGLVFLSEGGIKGMRADVVKGDTITVKNVEGIAPGDYVYRNHNIKFEKELRNNMPRRKIDVEVVFGPKSVTATDADGFSATLPLPEAADADRQEAAGENIRRNMGKRTDHFDFRCDIVEQNPVRFYPASVLNALRRALAEQLEEARVSDCVSVAGLTPSTKALLPGARSVPSLANAGRKSLRCSGESQPGASSKEQVRVGNRGSMSSLARSESCSEQIAPGKADYTANCANHLAREVLHDLGYEKVEDAYEIKPVPDAALMRSRYCIKYELGLCPKQYPSRKPKEPLSLINAGHRLRLEFDCKNCEMIVTL